MRAFHAGCLFLCVVAVPQHALAKSYKGAEYRTKASYLYGKFEARLKSNGKEGMLASFFTYNDSNPATPWAEIDIEILGRYTDDVQFNTITAGTVNHVSHHFAGFDPAADYHTYGFEWTPDYVAWFVDSVEVYRQSGSHIATLNQSQKIMMNVWNPTMENWAGTWNEAVLPAFAFYDWVRYSSYTPGAGTVGSGKNFTPQWTDNFDAWDQTRWDKATHTFGGNNCDFVVENAVFQDGKLILCLTKESATGYTDSTPPSVMSVRAEGSNLRVRFSKEVEKTSAETAANYIIPGATVVAARLSEDHKSVLLTVTGLDSTVQTNLILHNVQDRWATPNVMGFQASPIIRTKPVAFPLKINVGGSSALGYMPDQLWRDSVEYGRMDGQVVSYSGASISGTSEQEIYRTEVNDLSEFKVRLPNGRYLVTLMMAENYFKASNQRSFNVVVEGVPVETNLDLFARFGYRVSYAKLATAAVNDGVLDIHFQGLLDRPLLNGMTISQLPTGVERPWSENVVPKMFALMQNYPNPFNPSTAIRYQLSAVSDVTLKVVDVLGREVAVLVDGVQQPGVHTTRWDAAPYPTGIYFYQLSAGAFRSVKKMVLIK